MAGGSLHRHPGFHSTIRRRICIGKKTTLKERSQSPDTSPEFYRLQADRYVANQVNLVQRVWANTSHPLLKGNHSLVDALVKLAPGPKGLDAGCGAGAIDVADLVAKGLDVVGLDSIEENVEAALRLHPSLQGRVQVADLSEPLDFPEAGFDFVMCNAVIQHLEWDQVLGAAIPELARVLRPGGILQLVFKCGDGTVTLHDPDYDVTRSFQLHDVTRVVDAVKAQGMDLVPAENENSLGGLMYYTNNNDLEHCAIWARKRA
jgi:SAM-dependent methyltransferase